MNLRPRKSKDAARDGFILIASILVISLLTILVVASTVLSEIEIQAQYNASRVEMARQNALFGLSEALNQIQTATGPDCRVTARADILSTNSFAVPQPTSYGYANTQPATDSGQSFWTGVWRNNSGDFNGCAGNGSSATDPAWGQGPGPGASFLYYDYFPNGSANSTPGSTALNSATFPSRNQLYNLSNTTWLISWPGTSHPDPTASLSSQLGNVAFPSISNPSNTVSGISLVVPMIKNVNLQSSANSVLSGGSGAGTSVNAPRVPILATVPGSTTPVTVGSFAYWVADEGIKAKVNIPDPYLGLNPNTPSNFLQSQPHFQVAQSPAVNQSLALNTGGGFSASSAIDLRSSPTIIPTLASSSYGDTASNPSTWSDFAINPNTYSSDFTVDSLGVIADNFNGGLRQDLTAGLENQSVWWSHFSNYSKTPSAPNNPPEQAMKLYSINAICSGSGGGVTQTAHGICLDGMRWDSLFLYYNLYKVQMPSPCQTKFGNYGYNGIGSQCTSGISGSASAGSIPTVSARCYEENDGSVPLEIDPIYPRLALWSHSISVALNELKAPLGTRPSGTAGQYDLLLYANPNMVLYNPWDVNLQPPITKTVMGAVELISNISAVTSSAGNSATSPPTPPSAINDYNRFSINGASPPHDSVTPGDAGGTYTQAGVLGGNSISTSNQSALDSAPFMPGELRVFGVTKNITLAPTQFSPYYSRGLPCTNCDTYTDSNSEDLQSSGYAYGNYVGVECQLTTPLSAFHDDNLNICGIPTLRSSNAAIYLNNYSLWPDQATTSTSNNTKIGYPNFPSFGQFGWTSTVVDTVGNLVAAGTTSPPTPKLIAAYVDRMAGVFNSQAIPTINSSSGISSGTSGAFQSAFPGFVAGGSFFNPLEIDRNAYSRDFYNTGKISMLASSQSDVNLTWVNSLSPTSYIQTGWQPDSVGRGTTNPNVVIKSIPRQPLISLGQFKNMTCHYYLYSNIYDGSIELNFSFCPLGGSYQQGIPTSSPFAIDSQSNLYQDDNFLANEALFDSYFLSTVPPSSFNASSGWSDDQAWPISAASFNQTYINSNRPLPNSRLVYYARPQSSVSPSHGNPPASTQFPNVADLQCPNSSTANLRKPAANLLINGAFNINSTSVAAWEALLTSTSGKTNKLSVVNASPSTLPASPTASQSLLSFGTTDIPFLNFGSPIWIATPSNPTPVPNSALFGVVKLTNTDIANLAKQIVAQVQARGPALSLGDFLNHRLTGTANALSDSGLLQAAIDAANLGNNSSVPASLGGQAQTGFSNMENPVTGTFPSGFAADIQPPAPSNSAMGTPGTLTQADILQAIAPVIAARSDTFTVRVCGQAINPQTGITEASVWGEAVVQRLPEYLYSAENGQSDGTSAASYNFAYDSPSPTTQNSLGLLGITNANRVFGRRFKIVSFRWLNQNEI